MHSRNHNKNASAGEDFIISDERRLTELGRRSIEVTVLAHVFRKIEFEYREWVSLGEQKKLIRGEMEANVRCGTTDKEKNKSVKSRQVSIEEAEAKACELNVMFIETSAKAGFNIKIRRASCDLEDFINVKGFYHVL